MKKRLIFFILCTAYFFVPSLIQAQDTLFEGKDYATNVFRATILINSPTTEMIAPHSFNFTIRHRFGEIGMDKSLLKQFLGTDNTANIRFGFELPIGKFINAGIGRSKFGKTFDGELKAQLFRQIEGEFPISISLFTSVAYMSDAFPKVQENSFFEGENRMFYYKESHRFSFNSQIILSRKFSEKFSMLVNPGMVYQNLAPLGKDNMTLLVTAAISYKTGIKTSFLCEGSYLFTNEPVNDLFPFSAGWEWGTAGHVFQLLISSTNQLELSQTYTANQSDYKNGKLVIGFNIKRTFWSKKYKA